MGRGPRPSSLSDPLISHSLAAHLTTYPEPVTRSITTRVLTDCSVFLWELFGFQASPGVAYFTEDLREGLLKVIRLLLLRSYPEYGMKGWEAARDNPPVIYVSEAGRLLYAENVCSQVRQKMINPNSNVFPQLSIPQSCLRVLPTNKLFGSVHSVDVGALEVAIAQDVEAGRRPLMLMANAGTPLLGHCDNINRLQELTTRHKIWLHVDGASLASLAVVQERANMVFTPL